MWQEAQERALAELELDDYVRLPVAFRCTVKTTFSAHLSYEVGK